MSSAGDYRIARFDAARTSPALALGTYTDPRAMQSLLQSSMPGFAEGRWHIDAIDVSKARRNTSRGRNPCPMSLCYELQVSEAGLGRHGRQLFYAQVFPDDEAARAFAAAHRAHLTLPRFGEALVHLPSLSLLLWALPNDPGLPQLTELLDEHAAARLMPEETRGPVNAELLRYEPQGRATLRYRFMRRSDGSIGTVYAKTFCDGRGDSVYRRFSYFWQLAQDDAGAPLVGQPISHHAETRSFWQAPAPGGPLATALASHEGPMLMKQVANALALLHAAPLAPRPDAVFRTAAHWIGEVWRRRQKIGRADKAWASRAGRVADAIEAQVLAASARPLSLIHGDFHHEQTWVHDGRVVLFDFDEFTFGDPMEDLASFVLKLELAGMAAGLTAAFIAAYQAAAPQRFDQRALAWHLTIQTLLQASRCFVYQRAGWQRMVEQRLAASELRAAALGRSGAP